MNKFALAAAGLAVIASGLWYYSQQKAETEVRKALADADLIGVVSYEDVSYNPTSGTVTIHKPRADSDVLSVGTDDFRISTVSFSNLENDEGIPTSFHIKLDGMQYNILTLARNSQSIQLPGMESNADDSLLGLLVMLGYQAVNSSLQLDYEYDPEDMQLDLLLNSGTDDMGELEIALSFGNVSQKVIRLVHEVVSSLGSNNTAFGILDRLGPAMESLQKVSINNIRFTYDDDQLLQRAKRMAELDHEFIHLEPMPDDALRKKTEDLHKELVASMIPEEMAAEITEKLANFAADPDRISILTKIDSPVRISNLVGKSPGSILALLNLQIEG